MAALRGLVAFIVMVWRDVSSQMHRDHAIRTGSVVETAYGVIAHFAAEGTMARLAKAA